MEMDKKCIPWPVDQLFPGEIGQNQNLFMVIIVASRLLKLRVVCMEDNQHLLSTCWLGVRVWRKKIDTLAFNVKVMP